MDNIAYVVSDLKRVGPTNQTLNIIKNSDFKEKSIVITLFDEPKDSMIEEYTTNNIKIISLHLNRKLFFFNGIVKLKKTLKEYNINLVHSYGIIADTLTQKSCKNIPHVITLRNYPKEDISTRMTPLKSFIALNMHLKTLKNCKHLVTCSKTVARKMKNDYPNLNLVAIQNGVDIEKFNCNYDKSVLRKKYNFETDGKIYICTNSFTKRKRIDETIECFIENCNKNDYLLLLGKGDLFLEIKNKYSFDNIKFLGKVDNVIEYLNLSDYFISSSESEGLPNAVLESISCGLPVLLSNIDEHKEVLNEIKDVGELYELGSIKSFKKIYNYSFGKPMDIREKICNSDLTMKKMSKKYVELYKKILESK